MNGISVYQSVQKVSQSRNPTAEFIEEHYALVKRIAYHLKGRLPDSVMVEDLIQSGIIGLIEAQQKFDETQGASFETYAGIRIRGAMLDEIRKGDWTPRSVHRKGREVAEAIAIVEAREGRVAEDHEVAKELGMDLEEYYQVAQDAMSTQILSIDEPENEGLDEDQLISDDPTPLQQIAQEDFQQALAEQISDLPEKEKLVMALYYDEELNLKEIGLVLGVSESRVSQIHAQAISRLRSRLKDWM